MRKSLKELEYILFGKESLDLGEEQKNIYINSNDENVYYINIE